MNTQIILFSIIGFYACYCSIFVISLCKEYDIPQSTIQKLKYLYGTCNRSCCRKKRIHYSIVDEDEAEVEVEYEDRNHNDNEITGDQAECHIRTPSITLTKTHMQPTNLINNVKKDTVSSNSDYTPIIFRSEYDILHDSIATHTHNDIASHDSIASHSHIHTYRRNNLDTIYEYSDDDDHDALDNAGDFVPGESLNTPI